MRDRLDGLLLTDHAFAQSALDVLEPVAHIAEDHVLRDLRSVRDDVDDVVRRDLPAAIDLDAHGRSVEPADYLVGQVQMPLIARRHLERGFDRLIGETYRVVAFESRT